jgi:hypothetical protein
MQVPAAPAFRFGRREIVPHGIEMRMNFQRAAKTNRGFTKLAEGRVT